MNSIPCPVCGKATYFLTEKKDRFNADYRYVACKNCHFLFEEDLVLHPVNLAKKVSAIYQKDYFEKFDSGWKMRGDGAVAIINACLNIYAFITFKKTITVLDYGGGNGYVTSKINPRFTVLYYDKYEKPTHGSMYEVLSAPKPADVIYAVELVEHITNINEWDFLNTLRPDVFLFTTCLSNGIDIKELPDWDYLDPDAGHTALYSFRALYLLAKKYGFVYFFFPNRSFHIFWRNKFLSKINIVAVEYFFYRLLKRLIKGK